MTFEFKASVTVTTFNRKEQLKNVLAALDGQQGRFSDSFEVLVADDGSTDGAEDLVNGLIAERSYRYPLRYFNTHLTHVFGAGMARNLGIRNARGEYLLFIDDDCMPHRRWVYR